MHLFFGAEFRDRLCLIESPYTIVEPDVSVGGWLWSPAVVRLAFTRVRRPLRCQIPGVFGGSIATM